MLLLFCTLLKERRIACMFIHMIWCYFKCVWFYGKKNSLEVIWWMWKIEEKNLHDLFSILKLHTQKGSLNNNENITFINISSFVISSFIIHRLPPSTSKESELQKTKQNKTTVDLRTTMNYNSMKNSRQ